ncbi:hypothetical protein, partial [Streptosporangium saharense]|uniref:hypothetical protein n=1 Tax=Streptosporangium saharense TaxID=1706840 RepID=UPI00331D5778
MAILLHLAATQLQGVLNRGFDLGQGRCLPRYLSGCGTEKHMSARPRRTGSAVQGAGSAAGEFVDGGAQVGTGDGGQVGRAG